MTDYGTSTPSSATTGQAPSLPHGPVAGVEDADAAAGLFAPTESELVVFSQLAHISSKIIDLQERAGSDPDDARTAIDAQYLVEVASEICASATAPGAVIDVQLQIGRIEALMSGALAIERADRPAAAERLRLTEMGRALAERASISYSFGQDGCEDLALGMTVAGAALAQPPFTGDEYRLILEQVAGNMGTLTNTLRLAMRRDDDWSEGIAMSAALCIAEKVGAMADMAIGGAVIGTAEEWLFGFKKGGAA